MDIKFIQYSRDFPSGKLMVFMNGRADKMDLDDESLKSKERYLFGFGQTQVNFRKDLFQNVPIYSPSGKLLSNLPPKDITKMTVDQFDSDDFYDFDRGEFLITKNVEAFNHKFVYPALLEKDLDVAFINLDDWACEGIYDENDQLEDINYCARFYDLLKSYGSALSQKFNGSREVKKEYTSSRRLYDQAIKYMPKNLKDFKVKRSLEAECATKRDLLMSKFLGS